MPIGLTIERFGNQLGSMIAPGADFSFLIACGGAACEIRLVQEGVLTESHKSPLNMDQYISGPFRNAVGDLEIFRESHPFEIPQKRWGQVFFDTCNMLAPIMDLDFVERLALSLQTKRSLSKHMICSYDEMKSIRDRADVIAIISAIVPPDITVDRSEPRDPYGDLLYKT